MIGAARELAGATRHRLRGLVLTYATALRFRGELRPHVVPLAGAFLASIGYTAMRLAEPWPLKLVLDSVLSDQPIATPFASFNSRFQGDTTGLLAVCTVAILAIALLRGVFYYQETVLASSVGQRVVMDMRRKLFAHLQRLPMSYHARASTGDLLTRLTGDIIMLRELVVATLLAATTEVVVIVAFLAVMWLMDPLLSVTAIVSMPLIFGLVSFYGDRIKHATRRQRQREGELASRLHEVLSGIHVVQAFTREDDEDDQLRQLNRRSLRSGLKTTRLEAQMSRGVELAIAGSTAATIWIGALRVLDGALTPGELIVFISYMRSFHKPLRRVSSATERASKASSCLERVTEVLDTRSDVRDGERVAPALSGDIEWRAVSFAYGAHTASRGAAVDGTPIRGSLHRPVLFDINLKVRAGATVALVGHSGAGKTSLIGLVPRLFDPVQGAVLVDGVDVRELTLKSLRDQISVVPQDGMLFRGTIAENIAYGRMDATHEEIEAAARAALIHEHVLSLPDGYDTVIGERGVSLSGGQRQRLAIARALVRDAPIVLLDEPTTGLDAGSEAQVLAAMNRLLEGRTAIIIAHRLQTIRNADEIVVLEAGRIVERGTHAELIAAQGTYRDLYAIQFATEDLKPARRRRKAPVAEAAG